MGDAHAGGADHGNQGGARGHQQGDGGRDQEVARFQVDVERNREVAADRDEGDAQGIDDGARGQTEAKRRRGAHQVGRQRLDQQQ